MIDRWFPVDVREAEAVNAEVQDARDKLSTDKLPLGPRRRNPSPCERCWVGDEAECAGCKEHSR